MLARRSLSVLVLAGLTLLAPVVSASAAGSAPTQVPEQVPAATATPVPTGTGPSDPTPQPSSPLGVTTRTSRVAAPPSGCLVTGDFGQAYAAAGGRSSALGTCTGNEAPVNGGGAAQPFQNGSLYRSPATGAHTLYGAIRGRYASAGWENSPLGFPTTDEFEVRGGRGQHFQGGSIYWSPATGAHDVAGAIREEWAVLGWENSPLGFPLTSEVPLPRDGGRLQRFSGGVVYWTARTGARTVRGAILSAWADTGYEGGRLGYPTSDEYDVPGGRRSDFQFGSITWDAATGRVGVSTVPRVAVIGDSITYGACGGTAQTVPSTVPAATAACFGWPGSTSDEMQAFVEDQGFRSAWPGMPLPTATVDLRRAVDDSDVLVLGLGTNDALRDRAAFPTRTWPLGDTAPVPSGHVPVGNGYFDQKIDWFMGLAAGKPVYWYDLGFNGTDRATGDYFRARNERLAAATRRWPNLHVMAWSGVVAAHPEFLVDEVHPNEAGRAARWALLTSSVWGH
ncbi:GDSL-type esterase/lipase family protein [Kineococcus sp. NBC_00420]|uniref:GDSL-type esterase/lipase family protein n=1 Tax=Kineococcus sp. NBC_00420 TaxID=2903564 RepID=UPI002E215809